MNLKILGLLLSLCQFLIKQTDFTGSLEEIHLE
jgi:hypothetical protein